MGLAAVWQRRLRSLQLRLIGLLTVALLPLGLISLYQTRSVIERADELARGALIAEARAAVAEERRVLIETVGAARGLGVAILPTLDDPARCSEILRAFIAQSNQIAFAGYVPRSGVMTCSSHGETVDFSGFRGWAEMVAAPSLNFQVNTQGVVSGQSVLIANIPVFVRGALTGYLSISIPHAIIRVSLPAQPFAQGFELMVLNREGQVLSASGGLEGAQSNLPQTLDPDAVRAAGSTVFGGRNQAGEMRVFATFTFLEDEILVVGSWPESSLGLADGGAEGRLAVLFPFLMWIAGVGVGLFGLHRLVIRHVEALRDAMRRFALGERNLAALKLESPPVEFAEAERAFNRMVLLLSDAEARKEQDLEDKEVLLREVHHRVKNNLQMIASMMNMQSRTVSAPETHRVLNSLQRRVRGLAAVHQSLYTTTEMSSVDVGALAEDMIAETAALVEQGSLGVAVERDLEPLHLFPDQAVPLSMVLSEMLTNAFKYVGKPKGGEARILVKLRKTPDGEIALTVENTRGAVPSDTVEKESTGIGTRLMRAFMIQLDGKDEVEEQEQFYRRTIRFKRTDFALEALPR